MQPFKVTKPDSNMSSLADEDLFSFMKNSEADQASAKQAWNEFYNRYYKYLWNCCLNACKSFPEGKELAKDIFQTTIEKIYAKAHTFDSKKNTGIKSWMGTIAQNEFLDHIKRSSKFVELEEDSLEEMVDEEYSEEEKDLAEKLLTLRKEQLEQVLKVLNYKEYKILMTYMNNHQPDKNILDELCNEFKIKPDTPRQIKRRAIIKLMKAVKNIT